MHAGRFASFVDGRRVAADGAQVLDLLDPSTGEAFADVVLGTTEDADAAVESAATAFRSGPWRRASLAERTRALLHAADVLEDHVEELARLDVHTAGLSPSSARWGIRAAAEQFRYYAGLVDKLEGATIPVHGDVLNYTVWEPAGVTLHILPSNSPVYLFGRSVAAALAAGNTAVVKPAEQTTPSAVRLAELLVADGVLPAGVVNVVAGLGPVVGEALLGHPRVAAITFTGSVEIGRHVMQRAAERVVPVVLELGGKAPFVLFPDAELARAVPAAVKGAFDRAGQVCVARTRLLVHRSQRDEVIERLLALARALRVGPATSEPDVGPLISASYRERVGRYVGIGVGEGAELALGGGMPAREGLGGGFYFEPTVFVGVRPEMRIAREEIFGPVLSVLEYDEEEEAVALANEVPYGLYAEVWTRDLARAHRVAGAMEVGRVGVNGDVVAPQVPSAGYKHSGIGVEKGLLGIRNYQRLKTVSVVLGG